MSTSYEIRCLEHYDGDASADELARWPEDGVRRYSVPGLHALIRHRPLILEVAELGVGVTLESVFGGDTVGGFFHDHAACELAVFDEYGRRWDQAP